MPDKGTTRSGLGVTLCAQPERPLGLNARRTLSYPFLTRRRAAASSSRHSADEHSERRVSSRDPTEERSGGLGEANGHFGAGCRAFNHYDRMARRIGHPRRLSEGHLINTLEDRRRESLKERNIGLKGGTAILPNAKSVVRDLHVRPSWRWWTGCRHRSRPLPIVRGRGDIDIDR